MMLKRLVLIFLLITANVFASTPEQKLNQMLQHFDSLSAQFKQTTYAEDGSKLQTSAGSILILRPGQFRWDQKTPLNQQIISNGKMLWIYDPDLNQATQKNLTASLTQTPLLLLSNKNYALKKSFVVTALANHRYELLPKATNEAFKLIILQFAHNKISGFRLVNKLNQITDIRFQHVKLNVTIPKTKFSFKPPKGVEMVDLTTHE